MRRVLALVLVVALFVDHVAHTWAQHEALWLRYPGGKLGLPSDLDGLYVPLVGISAVFVAAATLAFTFRRSFPRAKKTCGNHQRDSSAKSHSSCEAEVC